MREREKNSLCTYPLEDSEGTEEVHSSVPSCQISSLSPSLFRWWLFLIDPGGVGASFFFFVHPSPSLSLVFFFKQLEPPWWGRLVMVFRYAVLQGFFFWRKGIRDCRVCVVVCLGWVVRFVIVFDYASPMCSVSLLNWVFQFICLFVKFDRFV